MTWWWDKPQDDPQEPGPPATTGRRSVYEDRMTEPEPQPEDWQPIAEFDPITRRLQITGVFRPFGRDR